MKTLIVYGSDCEATAEIAEEIAKTLRDGGFNVKVINLSEERIENTSKFELVVVGSEIQINKWSTEAESFLKKFQEELPKKKVAIFVSSALFTLSKIQGKKTEVDRTRKNYLEQKAAACSLTPIALTIFGGVLDFNKLGFLARRNLNWAKSSFAKEGYEETKPGVYDTRDWNEIREWARKLVLKARYL